MYSVNYVQSVLFHKNISRTSAVSWTNFGSITNSSLQAALLVLVIYYVGELFHNGRGHIV